MNFIIDNCATNRFKQYVVLMHWTWRAVYVSMGCDKYINCKKLEKDCCSGGFAL